MANFSSARARMVSVLRALFAGIPGLRDWLEFSSSWVTREPPRNSHRTSTPNLNAGVIPGITGRHRSFIFQPVGSLDTSRLQCAHYDMAFKNDSFRKLPQVSRGRTIPLRGFDLRKSPSAMPRRTLNPTLQFSTTGTLLIALGLGATK